jgi:hypothetical protein
METQERLSITLDTDCSCSSYDEDLDQDVPLDYCEGTCWEDQVMNFQDSILDPWLTASNATDAKRIGIKGRGMTWQRLSGEAITNAERLLDTMSFGHEYRLVFTLDNNNLTATRYSHDEPMGSSFEFQVMRDTTCDRCGEWIHIDRYNHERSIANGDGLCEECCEIEHDHFGN